VQWDLVILNQGREWEEAAEEPMCPCVEVIEATFEDDGHLWSRGAVTVPGLRDGR